MSSFRFGDFVLDVDRSRLLRNDSEVDLRPQSFDVLRYLVEHAGQLISKDQLHAAVWGNIAVTDDSIAHCISDIRKALGDKDRTTIRTVPRRGYLFAAAVEAAEISMDLRSRHLWARRSGLLALGLAASAAIALWWLDPFVEAPGPANAVAILPFVDLSPNEPDAGLPRLANSFSAALRDQLGRVPELRIAARSSSEIIAEQGIDAVTMAKRLGVGSIVEGSYSRDGNALRISVALLDGESGLSIWSQTYDRRNAEKLSIQQAIAEEVVAHLLPEADIRIAPTATLLASANELMLIARNYEMEVRDQPEVDIPLLQKAIAYYREATEMDPDSALAHSRLAGALLYLGDVDGAAAPIFKALSIDPNLAEVQDTLGKYYWANGRDDAGKAWEKALELGPYNADANASYAFWLWLQGNSDGPDLYYRKALENDPESLSRYWELGNFLGTQGKIDQIRALMAEVKARFDGPESFELLARLHEFLGEVDHAIAWSIRVRDLDPDNPVNDWRLAELYAVIGDYRTAVSIENEPGLGLLFLMRRYDELVDKAELLMFDEPDDVMVRYLLAFGLNATGNFSASARILRASGVREASQGWPSAIEVEAGVSYANAIAALGEMDEIQQIGERFFNRRHVQSLDWWSHAYAACMHAILGDDAAAMARFRKISGSARLPWYPMIKDSPCFRRFADHPAYVEVIETIDNRRSQLRERLPSTLADYGVSL